MRKKIDFNFFDLFSVREYTPKRKYKKKRLPDPDSNIGEHEMELAKDEGEVETEPWKITGTNGCAAAVKALRVCFKGFLEVYSEVHFTGRLMKVVSEIYQYEHERGGKTRSIFFSKRRSYLKDQIEFSKKRSEVDHLYYRVICKHSELRNEVKVSSKVLRMAPMNVPKGVSHFRIVSHLSIISDYFYVEGKKRFEPISKLNTMSVCAYSEYLPVYAYSDFEVVVRFPDGVLPSENDTVMHCLVLELYRWCGQDMYDFSYTGSGMAVCDVF